MDASFLPDLTRRSWPNRLHRSRSQKSCGPQEASRSSGLATSDGGFAGFAVAEPYVSDALEVTFQAARSSRTRPLPHTINTRHMPTRPMTRCDDYLTACQIHLRGDSPHGLARSTRVHGTQDIP